MLPDLPIQPVLQRIGRALHEKGRAVVQAPPGAGKTTAVPLYLLDASWLGGQRILLLEPRRMAARAAAARMSELLRCPLGSTVGYHIRMDRRSGPGTRIEVVTEGILTRRLQGDPALDGVGLVIFDEFHERSLNSDLGLALCLESIACLREDLRLLVMSATLDAAPVARLMGDAPVITARGRAWPVETRYHAPAANHRGIASVERACAAVIEKALVESEGDILVFLPGEGEIRRLEQLLSKAGPRSRVDLYPLFAALPSSARADAIRPSPRNRRKIVLATSIAETSLTIEGVRVVIDAGLMRRPRFHPGTGMGRLVTLPVSRAAADQRRGRAGRTAPGVCYRLWAREHHHQLLSFTPPEILHADLAVLVLELAQWGVTDPLELAWLDPPPDGAFHQATELLERLGAVDAAGRITRHGKKMAALGVHPRLAHMLLAGRAMGAGAAACRIAALLEARDPFVSGRRRQDCDLRSRLELLAGNAGEGERSSLVHRGRLHAIRKVAGRLAQRLGIPGNEMAEPGGAGMAGRLLAHAYPDRIALKRPGRGGDYLMASGTGAQLPLDDPLCGERLVVAADLDGNQRNARIFRAAAYTAVELETDFSHRIHDHERIEWDRRSRSVRIEKQRRFGALVLERHPLKNPDHERVAQALLQGVRNEGLRCLPWTPKLRAWQARAVFACRHAAEETFPDLGDETLAENLEGWLLPWIGGITSLDGLGSLDLTAVLGGCLTWQQRQFMDRAAPSHLTVPSGSRIPLDYGARVRQGARSPVLAVRLQEMFGMADTPRVGGGTVPVTLHLLSPAGRPVQITQDLASFWSTTYPEVKKDLMGRYPRHAWPEDPLTAPPTNRAKSGKG